LIEKFDAVVKTYQIPAELEDEVLKAFKKYSRENMTEQTSKVHTHDAEVQKIAQKLSNLDDMRIDGEIDSETYKEKRGKLITDQKKLLKKQEEYIAMEHMNTLTIDETVKLIKDLYGTWRTWDLSRKVSFIKMAAVKLEVDKKKRLLVQQKEVFEDLSMLFVSKWLRVLEEVRTAVMNGYLIGATKL
jgi:myosin heavy subunit